LETSQTCCEKRGDNQADEKPLFQCTHCLDTTHICEGLLARREEQERRRRGGRVEHGWGIVGDQPHGHGDIQAVLREEASDVPFAVAIDSCFEAVVRLGDEVDEPENQEDDESGKNELLTFHCVFPQKNGS
jgi:hypothetical protein